MVMVVLFFDNVDPHLLLVSVSYIRILATCRKMHRDGNGLILMVLYVYCEVLCEI